MRQNARIVPCYTLVCLPHRRLITSPPLHPLPQGRGPSGEPAAHAAAGAQQGQHGRPGARPAAAAGRVLLLGRWAQGLVCWGSNGARAGLPGCPSHCGKIALQFLPAMQIQRASPAARPTQTRRAVPRRQLQHKGGGAALAVALLPHAGAAQQRAWQQQLVGAKLSSSDGSGSGSGGRGDRAEAGERKRAAGAGAPGGAGQVSAGAPGAAPQPRRSGAARPQPTAACGLARGRLVCHPGPLCSPLVPPSLHLYITGFLPALAICPLLFPATLPPCPPDLGSAAHRMSSHGRGTCNTTRNERNRHSNRQAREFICRRVG